MTTDAAPLSAPPPPPPPPSARLQRIAAAFQALYGIPPAFLARAPGRVNLIGEHIDYSGFAVLPMALDRDVVIAVAVAVAVAPGVSTSTASPAASPATAVTVRVANTNSVLYPPLEFTHEANLPIDASRHAWTNYFKCGYRGAVEQLPGATPRSLYCLVDGTVPAGAGASSSSALVCAAALATATALGGGLTQLQLTQAAIRAERFAGVLCGGMDQAISMLGESGAALLIGFFPTLTTERVDLPPGDYVFVVANSLVTADKHVSAPTCYNLRVAEMALACALLTRALNLPPVQHVKHLLILVPEIDPKELLNHLHPHPYTLHEIAAALDTSVVALSQTCIPMPIQATEFHLHDRLKHVLEESARVLEFKRVATEATANATTSSTVKYFSTLEILGNLMNESQNSCRDLFDCSCPELETLTTLARRAGALGSRLTGAGWGGCTVSLVPTHALERFRRTLIDEYYKPNFPRLSKEDMSNVLFSSRPCGGAEVLYSF